MTGRVRLRPRIISTFSTTRVVGRQPYAPATFTPGEIPGTHFQRLSRPQGAWFCRKERQKKSQVTPPGMDPGTVRPVEQRLNHYATPGPPCHTAVLGEYFLTFLRKAVLPFSRVNGSTKRPFFTNLLPLESGDTLFLRNTGNLSYNSAVLR